MKDKKNDSEIFQIETDKDIWIYSYGSDRLQRARTLGYECETQYLKERLRAEYPGFRINTGCNAEKVDFPPQSAIKQSLRWDNAYIARKYMDGEFIAIDNYLGKYQIVKRTRYLLYLVMNIFSFNNFYSPIIFVFICTALMLMISYI
jgi:hypothetical protein